MSRLGKATLSFQEILATNVNWINKKDPSLTKLQTQDLTIPLTQLELQNMGGTFKVTFYNNIKQWEPMVEINKAMEKIKLERKTQDIKFRPQVQDRQYDREEERSNHCNDSFAKERSNHGNDSFAKERSNHDNNSFDNRVM